MEKGYWLSRPDKDNLEYFSEQINRGFLRQGWGYDKSQDLRTIKEIIDNKGWNELRAEQQDATPNLMMLVGSPDNMQIGDIVIVPNVPKWGYFYIVEIIGEYSFQIDPQVGDYGHIVPCKRICDVNGINKHNQNVPAVFRSPAILHYLKRNKDLNDYEYSAKIEEVLNAIDNGENLTEAHSIEDKADYIWKKTETGLRDKLRELLNMQFINNEWEVLLKNILEKFYPHANVYHTGGGNNEYGADLLIEINNIFEVDFPYRIPIQVKNHEGDESSDVVSQLKEAYKHYNENGIVISVVLLTTANIDNNLRKNLKEVSDEIGTKISAIGGDRLIDMICEGLVKTNIGPELST